MKGRLASLTGILTTCCFHSQQRMVISQNDEGLNNNGPGIQYLGSVYNRESFDGLDPVTLVVGDFNFAEAKAKCM